METVFFRSCSFKRCNSIQLVQQETYVGKFETSLLALFYLLYHRWHHCKKFQLNIYILTSRLRLSTVLSCRAQVFRHQKKRIWNSDENLRVVSPPALSSWLSQQCGLMSNASGTNCFRPQCCNISVFWWRELVKLSRKVSVHSFQLNFSQRMLRVVCRKTPSIFPQKTE